MLHGPNREVELSRDQIKHLNAYIGLYTKQVRDREDELDKKNAECAMKTDCLSQIEDDIKIMHNHITELDENNAMYC